MMALGQNLADTNNLISRAEQLISLGRTNAARSLLAAARGLSADSSRLAILSGRLALNDGILENAEEELDSAIISDPGHPGLRKCRAELRRQFGDLEGATRDAAEAVILDRHDPSAIALLGTLLRDIGRPVDAETCLRQAVGMAQTEPSYREALSNTLAVLGDLDGALNILREGIALIPGSAAIRNAAILLCIRRRDFSEAHTLAEAARDAGVSDASTFGLNGHALSALGYHRRASLAYGEALKLAPEDAYVRHLAASAGYAAGAARAPDDYVRTLFDGYADHFESHLVSLGYRVPGLMRRKVMALLAQRQIGPVLDLGCGTGLVALALSDLNIGPFSGVDISPRMLEEARAKRLYEDLQEAELPAALIEETRTWNLILAADLLCYFGALEPIFGAVRARLKEHGRFIFSLEELLPTLDGQMPGNGDWALGRMGRYAHSARYVSDAASSQGLHIVTLEAESPRFEGGEPVNGFLVMVERSASHA